jgi:AcrR family transcriptional regulator
MTNSWYDIVPKASENVANQQKTSLTLGTRSVQARLQLHPPARAQSAFSLFVEQGFSSTSMLDIVTRARVSKRDLYALFHNKHAVLAAGISERAQRMRRPLDTTTPVPQTGDALAALLIEFGVSILKTVCHPEVLAVFRLAIAESDSAPEIARTLYKRGREANQKALASERDASTSSNIGVSPSSSSRALS